MAGCLAFFGLGRLPSLPASPSAIGATASATGPTHRATLTIEFDQAMDQLSTPADDSLYRLLVDGVPTSLFSVLWISGTELKYVGTDPVVDGQVISLQCPYGDPAVRYTNGIPCLGWQPLTDTYLVAKGLDDPKDPVKNF